MKKYVVPVLLVFAALAAAGPLAAQAAPTAAKPEAKSGAKVEKKSALTPELLSGLAFRNIGPALMSGRISDIVIHPLKRHTWYVAVGSGGVWKTENAGTTWTPVFDAQASYSIGCITLDPSNPETVWVGTGENVSGRHVGFGDGVYKSLNGGKTWTNMGLPKSEHIGRILIDPRNQNVVYVAAEGPLWSAGGERGLYKTTDGGKTWALVLEISKDTGVTSAEFDPANPDILYAAAYQRRRSVAAFMGGGPESGIHKSEDAGKTWRKLAVGLPSGDVGKIGLAVSPIDPRIVYATVEAGPEEKGFYRSTDKGESWEKRNPYISGGTGPHYYQEIFADPNVFDRVYQMDPSMMITNDGGKTWRPVGEKSKHGDNHAMAFVKGDPDYILNGSDGGVYESHDGGKTWRFFENLPVTQFYKLALDNALPFYNIHGGTQDNGSQLGPSRTPNGNGISNFDWAITFGADGYASAIDPRIVYATVEAGPEEKGFYRSTDKGESWEKRNPYISGGTGPHYYQEIFADPNVFDRVYQMDPSMMITNDGGKTWRPVGEKSKHGDNHAMAFVKGDPDYILNGSDGGVYESHDGGKTWRFFENLPVTQFYKLALDNALPFYNVHGGAQDNGSQLGPSRTLNGNGISNFDWAITFGADGYASAIDPTDANTLYVEMQEGVLFRYDKKNQETLNISPKPEPGDPPLRFNWDSPVVISPFSHTRVYYASQYLWRSDDRGDSWTRISPDLTRGVFRLEQKIMGREWSVDGLWDHGAMSQFSTITTVSESRFQEGLLYAGTDDGLIQVTEDGGKTWRKIDKVTGVPDNFFVNKIMASKHDKDAVYAAVDGHKTGDYKPYLLMSGDRGKTWTNIAGDMPPRNLVWSVAQDNVKKDLLFAGTEFGIYVTVDGGKKWVKLGGGVPTISFRDIEVQERESDLVGASFGRGFFILDDYSPLREMSEESLAKDAALFPVKKALQYMPLKPIDANGKGCLGETFYLAPNPPFGAVFTYYLKDGLKTGAEARREEEGKLVKDGKPVPFPGWDNLRKEENEEKSSIVMTIADEAGQVVRRFPVPSGKGLHRVAWDLRYPAIDPTEVEERPRDEWGWNPMGPLVVPGKFTAALAKKVDGVLTPLTESRAFVVESLNLASLPEKDRTALLDFQKKAGELQRAMMGAGAAAEEALKNIAFIKKALLDAPKADPKLAETARAIEKRLQDEVLVLFGDRTRQRRNEVAPSSLMDRVSAQLDATGPITMTVRRGYEIAADGFEMLVEEMRATIEVDLKKLQSELEAAGAPWTPGRGVPIWKKR